MGVPREVAGAVWIIFVIPFLLVGLVARLVADAVGVGWRVGDELQDWLTKT